MQAGRFLSLVKNVTDLRPEELGAAKDLLKRYPYSQLLQLIVARGSRDQKGADEQATLHRAAVYATDRTVLKTVMTRVAQPRVEALPVEEATSSATPAPARTESAKPTPLAMKADAAAPAAPIESRKPSPPRKKTEPAKQAPVKQEVPPSPAVNLEGDALRDDLKSELNRLHDLMSQFDASYEQFKKGEPPPAVTPPKASAAKQDTPPADAPLIDEIKTSKRKPKLVSPKVAEQGEIIDKFIKVAPTLPRTKPTEPLMDLSEDTGNYGDNIVSETLVEILIKQGKKEKAIEMLKKLIWKFPQKKAYFAAQIEALKS